MSFCTSGVGEGLKGCVHAAAGALIGVMGLYNAAVAHERGTARHVRLALLYTCGAVFEGYQAWRHWRK